MKLALSAVALALIAGGILASIGKQDRRVDLSSAREVWADVLRDADQIGLQVTRMSPSEEVALGRELAAGAATWAAEDPKDTQYVTTVAASMTPHLRRKAIPYQFHVIEWSGVNAFALPGGQIFVLRGMMDFLQNEAELAAVIGHEMAHVDLMHCVERYQYRQALKRAGVGELGAAVDMARILVIIGYNQFQEVEADADGARMAVAAGYDPDAAEAVFTRMGNVLGEAPRRPATTPAGEVVQSLEEALRDYFRTHPRSEERARRMQDFAARHPELRGQSFYVGALNYKNRVPRSASALSSEFVTRPLSGRGHG